MSSNGNVTNGNCTDAKKEQQPSGSKNDSSAKTPPCVMLQSKACYSWIIDNFNSKSEGKEKILSPSFYSTPTDDKGHCYEFGLVMYPVGAISCLVPGQVMFQLRLVTKAYARFRFTFTIMDCDRRARFSSDGVVEFVDLRQSSNKSNYNSLLVISREYILNMIKKNKLILQCCILDDSARYASKCKFSDIRKVGEDLGKLLEEHGHSDFSVKVGEREFRVHKAILAARSPVFAAMFEHDCVEKQTNQVDIPDFSDAIVEQFLRYLYTGEVVQIEKFAEDLLPIADKYQVDQLKCKCEQHLGNTLNQKNVCDVFLLSDLYDLAELRFRCVHFITDRPEAVMASEGWSKIKSRPNLIVQLFQNQSSKRLGGETTCPKARCCKKLRTKRTINGVQIE